MRMEDESGRNYKIRLLAIETLLMNTRTVQVDIIACHNIFVIRKKFVQQ